jgi:hypothetical protein
MNPNSTHTSPDPGAPGLASETWVSTKLPDDDLRRAFRTYALSLSAEHTPPPSSTILFRAERRRRRLAIERAERPLLIMQILGILSAVATAARLLYRFLGIACTFLVLAGCWAMLHASRRPSA